MKVKPLDKVICRTPVFSINTPLSSVFADLKLKIEESSPSFSEILEQGKSTDLAQLNEKTRYTLWKYFNRAKYRSTPFGSFASVSLVPLAEKEPEGIIIQQELDKSNFIDWGRKDHYLNKVKQYIGPTTSFLSNSSFYFTKNEIRYLKIKDKIHELATVSAIPELSTLLLTCKRKTESTMIYELMKVAFDMDQDQTTTFLLQLLDLQLLISEQYPNLIGTDYFTRLAIDSPPSPADYIISKRKLISGNFDPQYLKQFPAMISFLSKQLGVSESTDLKNFKQLFLKRFEHQEISLALVMDPEIGIGYGNFGQQQHVNVLVDEIKHAKTNKKPPVIEYGPFHAFLLNKIVIRNAIKLEEFKEEENKKPAPLPNTFSFIFHLFESRPVVAYGGGITANSLIGRFTVDHPEMEAYAKEISALESNANPEVIFFDIAYQAQGKVDNVNRRKSLYPYELPILTWSDTNMPLDLHDILVSVFNDEVILKSKQLGKRIVPRIPSAYNYTKSDLAVYRFLCDVKNQGLSARLSFKLQDFFPRLEYYPQVSFHQIIVSPATWLVPKSLYGLPKTDEQEQLEALKLWLTETKIHFRFKAGYSDATLCFDPKLPEDLWAFLSFCKQQLGDVYVSEALIAEVDCIKDEKGGLYFPQYIVNFQHQDAIYKPLNLQQQEFQKVTYVQLPGGDWLYFELYSHSLKGNAILLNQIQKIVKTHHKLLKKWFFIRYNQPSAHLRLRLHLKQKAEGFKIVEAFKSLIEPEIQQGSISDFKIKTYFRETHRYGAKRMNLVEQFFSIDSKYVLMLLNRAKSENQMLVSSLNLISFWLENWLQDLESQLSFVKNMADVYDSEMQIGTDHFKKINANFNELKKDFAQLSLNIPPAALKSYKKLLNAILSTCNGLGEERKLMADLIHMHVNRLFSADQRMYETVIYHFLLRLLQMKRATSKS